MTQMNWCAIACAGLLSSGVPRQAIAAAGDQDPSFGPGGRVVTSFPGGLDTANAVAVLPNGKIIVGGSAGTDFALTRYNADGTLDATFGDGGRVHTDFPKGLGGFAYAMVVQPADGKIVLAGTASAADSFDSVVALARYNADGTLDPSFGGDGLVTTPIPGNSVAARTVALQADGKIVIAGSATNSATFASVFLVARYGSDGQLDGTFNGTGYATTDFPEFGSFTAEEAHAVVMQTDGKIVVGGMGASAFALARYKPDGSLDATFGSGGRVTTAFGGTFEELNGLAIQTDGKIVAAGQTAISTSADDNFALARYNENGTLDATFNGTGKVTTEFGLVDGANAVVIQPDGMIVAAGSAGTIAGGTFFAVARYTTAGALDNGFDGDGKALADMSGGRFSLGAQSLALQADGKIIAAGDANLSGQRDFGVVRFNPDGTRDTDFGASGNAVSDFPLNDDAVRAVLVQPDGKIVAVGRADLRIRLNQAQDPNFQLARYSADGTLDPSFGTGGIVTTGFATDGDDYANAAALQPDGRIVVVGQVGAHFSQLPSANTAFGVARYHADGTLDTSFDGDGLVSTEFGNTTHDTASAVAIAADGKIVVAGTNGSDFAIARYNTDGSPDGEFGSGGKMTIDMGGNADRASAVLVLPDGDIIVGGTSNGNFAVARLATNGALDPQWGNGGRVSTDFDGGADTLNALLLMPDGTLVAGGSATRSNGNVDFALARYDNDGNVAGTFGSGGKVMTELDGYDELSAIAADGADRIIAVGTTAPSDFSAPGLFAVVRYRNDGTPDPAFGSGGTTRIDFFGIDNSAAAVAVQPDGRIVTAGTTESGSSRDFALVRLLGDDPARLLNISTRLRVGTGENALIAGFIITGTVPKRVIVRALGPSLMAQDVSGALENPTLELFDGAGATLAFNDDWRQTQPAEIEASTIPPSDDRESAIVRTLQPGNYTAVVRGQNETTGIGLVEVYDLSAAATARLANISSRGFVDTGDNVLIGGFILGGTDAGTRVVVRAIGPSLEANGIAGVLQDPTLQLVDANGVEVRANDNWQDTQRNELEAIGLEPQNEFESALVADIAPGNYTAVVRGNGNGTGVGLVEIYNVH